MASSTDRGHGRCIPSLPNALQEFRPAVDKVRQFRASNFADSGFHRIAVGITATLKLSGCLHRGQTTETSRNIKN